ncbi:SDR family NAD(P)-dependent oxidoreductase [Pseudalkalibacillus caeni]|uniref:SDR family NAD(P)-dependent oxidoreductase n=1 Tax=Exobacillus caeni TaxID=2574798 RepID=A0A5R9FE76_9BACL|nr:SDR family NAD(P)-dependent oxidoreductase [Pseudalkalibacillus caeni]TLS39183.1 SDR family NAD(P)-dependent oxidoreductase [Pseudalkalibacillus caeni]
MKVLITGGAGFIGSRLSKELLNEGHEVFIIDNFHRYYERKRKLSQLNNIKESGEFLLFEIDLLDKAKLEKVFQETRFDVLYHLAALPGVSYSIEQPNLYVDYDVKATVNVLEMAGKYEVEHVVFSSSSSVYGNQQGKPLSEEMANGKVISPYAASKYGAESFCHVYQHLYNFRLTILRYFTVYGPWGRPDMAIMKFANLLLSGKPIEVYGSNSFRDYTFIDDIVAGTKAVLHTTYQSETINLGAGRPVSIEDLLAIFKTHFPEMEAIRNEWRTGDVEMTWADLTRAKELLGYVPEITIEEGVARTVEWVKRNRR